MNIELKDYKLKFNVIEDTLNKVGLIKNIKIILYRFYK